MSFVRITYGISDRDLAEINTKLVSVGANVPRAIRNALNRTATSVRRELVSRVKNTYTYKGMKIGNIELVRASPARLEAVLKARGRTHTLAPFRYTVPKSGAKAKILKSSGLKLLEGRGGRAFKFGKTVAQRVSKKRLPLRVPRVNSVPKMVQQVYLGKHGGPAMADEISKKLHDEIQAEIAKVMARA